jgi:hypothetical protein
MAVLSRQEKRREQARRGQAKAIAHRRCPRCGRGNAITRDRWENDGVVAWIGRHCRYCDYASGGWVG